jgi:hypothetical protein
MEVKGGVLSEGLLKGPMPDITPPQIVGLLVGGVPILAEFLRAFGVYDISLEQQQALSNAVTWATVIGGALISGDALLRIGRNLRKGHVEAAIASLGEGAKLEVVRRSLTPGSTLDPVPPVDQGQAPAFDTGPTTGFEQPPQPPPV